MEKRRIDLVGETVEVDKDLFRCADDYQGQVLIYLKALNYRLKKIEEELKSGK